MKKAFIIVWHIFLISITTFLLFLIGSKISTSLANVDQSDAHWPAVQTGIVTMAVAAFAVVICAVGASAFFAGRIGTVRRVIAYVLVAAVFAAWIYVAFLWVNYPFKTMPTTLFGEMINFDAAFLVVIAMVLLLVPALTGRGLVGHIFRLCANKTRAQPQR